MAIEPVPSKRTRQFSFTSFSLTQPNKPPPGSNLDDEFDKTNTVVNDIIDFVRQAIADDGTIKLSALDESTYVLVSGPPGPPGPAFQPDATGNTATRSAYDAELPGFAYLDTQAVPPLLYFRQTLTPGVWSPGVVFNNGPTGPQGPTGSPGAPGAPGATILVITSGTPGAGLGNNNDLCINTTNGDVFLKSGGVWSIQGNIRGPQGPVGPTGSAGPTGPVGPQGPGLPAGAIQGFAMTTPPPGWLKANGALVSRTVYADLFAAIGTTWGAGDGLTTFRLPDYRGMFRRGWDDGRGVDTGRIFGAEQLDQNQFHSHTASTDTAGAHIHDFSYNTTSSGSAVTLPAGFNLNSGTPNTNSFRMNSAGAHSHTVFVNASGGSEARPRNQTELVCIKF